MKTINLNKLLSQMDPESEVSIQVNDTIHGTNTTSYDISYKLNDNDELVLIVSID